MNSPSLSTFKQLPRSKIAWWSVGLAAVFVVLSLVDMYVMYRVSNNLPLAQRGTMISFGFLLMLSGLAAGITGLIALLKKRERSWLTWLSTLPGLLMIFLLLGEFISPH